MGQGVSPRVPLLSTVGLALIAAVGLFASAASARSESIPSCPAGSVPPAGGPQPACVHGPWTSHGVAGLTRITGIHKVSASYVHVSANGGKNSYWSFELTVTYADSLANCPAPTPLSAIPCQSPGPPQISNYGIYVKGKPALVEVDNVVSTQPVCTSNERSCTFAVHAYPYETSLPPVASGPATFVIGVAVGEMTKTSTGAASTGDAGFEFALPIDVKKQ